MSLELAIPFELFGTGATNSERLLDGIYVQVGNNLTGADPVELVTDPDPSAEAGSVACRFPVPAGASSSAFYTRLRYALRTGWTTGGYAHLFYVASLPASDGRGHIVEYRDDANATQFGYYLMTTGQLRVFRGDYPGTTLGTTASPIITAGTWHHIELKATLHDSTGAIELRVNGVPVLDLENIDSKGAGATVAQIEHFVRMADLVGGGYTYIKNPLFWNSSGSVNNDFFGTCDVLWLPVDADVSFNWTPSTGATGFNLIDNAPPDDASYIEADIALPAASEFDFEDLPPDVSSVRGLIMLGRQWKIDGGDANTQMTLVSNGDDADGTDRPMTVSPTWWWDVSEVSPDTAVAWTPAETDAATIKINRTV